MVDCTAWVVSTMAEDILYFYHNLIRRLLLASCFTVLGPNG